VSAFVNLEDSSVGSWLGFNCSGSGFETWKGGRFGFELGDEHVVTQRVFEGRGRGVGGCVDGARVGGGGDGEEGVGG